MENPTTELSIRLKQAMEEKDLRPVDLAAMTGISKASISQYLSGYAKPNNARIYVLSKALDCSEAWLIGFDVPKHRNNNNIQRAYKTTQIPIVGKVAAGQPTEALEDILDYVDIPEEMAKKGNYFGLKINGHSMEPRICKDDVVIVRQQSWVEDGQIAIVMVDGCEATCKKVKYNANGITLISLNPTYEPIFFTHEQVANEPVTIIGRVVEVRGTF